MEAQLHSGFFSHSFSRTVYREIKCPHCCCSVRENLITFGQALEDLVKLKGLRIQATIPVKDNYLFKLFICYEH